MLIVGLTGGIASGKSTVSAIFHKAGAMVIDADVIARQVIAPGLPAWHDIKSIFGSQIMGPDGAIDRTVLGDLVFDDWQLRSRLEGIIHPRVRMRIDQEVIRLRQSSPQAVVILDVPLLFEAGMTEGVSEIIVVYTTMEIQLKRLMAREGFGRKAALARINSQLALEEKRRRATIVIDNSGALSATQAQTSKVFEALSTRAAGER